MLVEDMMRMCEEHGVPLRLDEDGGEGVRSPRTAPVR